MIIDMLEAVEQMLSDSEETKVQCASIMLIKIIEGMKRDNIKVVTQKIEEDQVKLQPPKKKVPNIPENQYAIVPNDDGSIREILNHNGEKAIDGKIELDGQTYTFQEAIGMKFTTGRIL